MLDIEFGTCRSGLWGLRRRLFFQRCGRDQGLPTMRPREEKDNVRSPLLLP
jgi:hypothetical protein